MKNTITSLVLFCASIAPISAQLYTATNALTPTVKGSITLEGSEIPAFDPASKRAFASSDTGIQVVNLTDPATPTFHSTIVPSTLGVSGLISNDVSSIAIRKGTAGNPNILAAAIINNPKTNNGHVIFLNAATGALIGSTVVGVVPDHIAFTPDGSKLLVCNEGELSTPEVTIAAAVPDAAQGTVSIIPVNAAGVPGTVQTANFSAFDAQTVALKAAGVRIFDDGVPSTDFEPEYLAISPDGSKALVTLQEANAVAILNIATATFESIQPLGEKDFSTGSYDFSDRDAAGGSTGIINPTTGNPVFGLYMPDAIASFQSGGQTYYISANEGDDRNDFINPNETTTVSSGSYDLDNTTFPTETTLKTNGNLGRLVVSNLPGLRGDTDNDGDIDRILSYGGRSFSIYNSSGARVYDSGDMIEMIVATQFPAQFDDGRSDAKGQEPEGITVAKIGARTFAFVGLERAHMTLAFDVTNPLSPTFAAGFQRTGDFRPEGLVVVEAADSPTGKPLLLVANEGDDTLPKSLTIFEIGQPTDYKLQLLHLADGEAGLLAPQTAPNLAALVDAFDGTYANTIILAGGDNYIPGPFAAAGTDASVVATHNKGNNPFAADIEIHNRIGVQASTIGNHEFDFGTAAFSDAINDTNFPYLSANLDFSGDSAISGRYQETVGTGGLEEASALTKKIVPSTVITVNGERIGLVGATTQIIESISSTGGVEVKGFTGDGSEANDMALLASQLQPVINDLTSQGVDKVILMAHLQQIAFEQQLAPLLTGVDIVLAAGSNTRLGDSDDVAVAFTGHAANFAGNYPIYTTGADGLPTVIVNTDNEYTYLGRLVVDFDADGILIVPNLKANTAVNGAYAATAANVAAAWGVAEGDLATTAFANGTKGALVKQITDAVQNVISVKDGDVKGYTNFYLEGERNFVRNQETNLGNISADANADALASVSGQTLPIVSLKNGGGIRAAIGAVDVVSGAKNPPLANPSAGKAAGGVSLLDIENSMRFNNLLMAFDTTPSGLKAILEHGVANAGTGNGRFPQIGGVAFSYDPTRTAGSRIRSIALIDEDGLPTHVVVADGAVSPSAPAGIKLVTLSFLAQGGDSYPMKTNGENFRFLLNNGTLGAQLDETLDFTAAGNIPANALGEQAAMATYMVEKHGTPATAYNQPDTTPANDLRIQNISVRSDTVLDVTINPTVAGGTGGSVSGGGTFTAGSTAQFTATPGFGFNFAGWTVNGEPAGTTNPLSVSVTPGLTVEANFEPASVTFIAATGGTQQIANYFKSAPYTNATVVLKSKLPSGLKFNPTTYEITGYPKSPVTINFTVSMPGEQTFNLPMRFEFISVSPAVRGTHIVHTDSGDTLTINISDKSVVSGSLLAPGQTKASKLNGVLSYNDSESDPNKKWTTLISGPQLNLNFPITRTFKPADNSFLGNYGTLAGKPLWGFKSATSTGNMKFSKDGIDVVVNGQIGSNATITWSVTPQVPRARKLTAKGTVSPDGIASISVQIPNAGQLIGMLRIEDALDQDGNPTGEINLVLLQGFKDWTVSFTAP